MNGLCDFLGNIFLSEANSLVSLVATGLVDVEIIYRFSFVTWSPDHAI